jgi:hypothetical protein
VIRRQERDKARRLIVDFKKREGEFLRSPQCASLSVPRELPSARDEARAEEKRLLLALKAPLPPDLALAALEEGIAVARAELVELEAEVDRELETPRALESRLHVARMAIGHLVATAQIFNPHQERMFRRVPTLRRKARAIATTLCPWATNDYAKLVNVLKAL